MCPAAVLDSSWKGQGQSRLSVPRAGSTGLSSKLPYKAGQVTFNIDKYKILHVRSGNLIKAKGQSSQSCQGQAERS